MKFNGKLVLAVAALALMVKISPLSVMAETDGTEDISGNALELQMEAVTESGLAPITGYCGDESENEGKNVTYAITDSDGDGIYDLLNIEGEGWMRDYRDIFGSVLASPWRIKDKEIKKIIINDGVTSIGDAAFRGCSSLSEIMIPEGVTSIGDHAFYECSSLSKMIIPEGVTSIGDHAFYECSSLSEMIIPEGVTSIGDAAFGGCSLLSEIIIPEGVTSIGDYAFSGCSSLSEIIIPEGVTSIGDAAFEGCRSLSEVIIPKSVKSIGNRAFSSCTSLTEMIIPEGVTFIDQSAFANCRSLKYLIIPESLVAKGEMPCPFNTNAPGIVIFVPINCPSIGYGPGNYPTEAFYKADENGNIIIVGVEKIYGKPDLTKIPDVLDDRLVRLALWEERDWFAESEHFHRAGSDISAWAGVYPTCSAQEGLEHGDRSATCVKNGNLGYGNCFICKKNFTSRYDWDTGKWEQKEIALEDTIIPATGHTGGNATCKQRAICTVCGEEYGDFAEHNYINAICTICGISSTNENTPSETISIPIGPDTWRDKTGVEGFVYRLYNVALIRDAEDAGLSDWTNRLDTKKESAAEVARGFFFSDEFLNRDYNNEQYVELLYRTMFGRDSDEAGKAYWLNCLENGASREYVYHGFAESQEFTGLCEGFGVNRGSVSLGQYRDQNIEATGFVARLYTKMLGRGFDDDGIEYWCKEYITGKKSIEDIAADGFLHSPEFTAQDLSDKEFVIRMYGTFLNREPDEAGLNDWVGRLERGEVTRDGLVYGFTNSPEFGKLKKEYNLP